MILTTVFSSKPTIFLGFGWGCPGEIAKAFDAFGASEVQARQATSTSLSVYTIAIALSCTIGEVPMGVKTTGLLMFSVSMGLFEVSMPQYQCIMLTFPI